MRQVPMVALMLGLAACGGRRDQPMPAPTRTVAVQPTPAPTVTPAAPAVDLTRYLGKYPSDKVDGRTFYRAARPFIVGAMGKQLARTLANYQVETPIARRAGQLIAMACVAHNCDAQSVAIMLDPDGDHARVCVHDTDEAGAPINSWYAVGEQLARTDACPWNLD